VDEGPVGRSQHRWLVTGPATSVAAAVALLFGAAPAQAAPASWPSGPGDSGQIPISVEITTSPMPEPPPNMPRTGDDVLLVVELGLALISAGTIVVAATRRQRDRRWRTRRVSRGALA
jgi:hypothetical protein